MYKGEILLETNPDYAAEEYLEVLRLSEFLSTEDRMLAHRKLGECYILTSQHDQAQPHLKIYLDLATSEGSLVEQQRAWTTLGRCLHGQSDSNGSPSTRKQADDAYMKSLQLAEKLRDSLSPREYAEMKGRALYNIALVRDTTKADVAQMLESALYLFKKYELKEDLCRCFEHLAETHMQRGDSSSALLHCDRWIETAISAKRPDKRCEAYIAKGKACLHADMWEAARKSFKRAYYVRTSEHLKAKAARLLKMSIVVGRCEAALTSAEDGGEKSRLYEEMADAFAKCGFHSFALSYYLLAIESGTAAGTDGKRLGDLHASVAATYKDMKDLNAALSYYEKELAFRKNDPAEAGKTKLIVARTMMEMSPPPVDEARGALEEALQLFRKAGDGRSESACLDDLLSLEMESRLPEGDAEEEESTQSSNFSGVDLDDLSECSDGEPELEARNSRPRRRRIEARVNWKGETPLHLAVIEGSLKKVEALLKTGHSVQVRDNAGWQPLHEAANFGFLEIARCLVETGKADVNDPGGPKCEGVTPLHDALQNGNLEVGLYLLEKGASVNARTHLGKTPLDCLLIWKKKHGTDLEDDRRPLLEDVEAKLRRPTQSADASSSGARRADRSGATDAFPSPDGNGCGTDAVVATALVDEDAEEWCVDDLQKRRPKPRPPFPTEPGVSRKRSGSFGHDSRHKTRRRREERKDRSDPEEDDVAVEGEGTVEGSPGNLDAASATTPAASLRVRIRDKLLLVPVPPGADETVGWLANEAAERYFHLVGIRPVLNVALADGAVVDPSDPLRCVANCSALIGDVVSWHVPPLRERYSKACEKAGVATYARLAPLLEDCEARGAFNLHFAQLERLELVFEALRHQQNLHTLDIRGTRLNVASVSALSSCVGTLSATLRSLGLRCVGLTAELLRALADPLGETGICDLDLSYNRLGGDKGTSVGTFLARCPKLKRLGVSGCGLSDFGTSLERLRALESLEASDNPLSESGAAALASLTRAGPLRSVDLSNSLPSANVGCTLKALFLRSTCGLREIGLRSCNIGDAEAEELCESLPRGSLLGLDLTGNPSLSKGALQKLSAELAGVKVTADRPLRAERLDFEP